jgi:hypothetical protein
MLQHNYIADQLVALRDIVRQYDCPELQFVAMTLTNMASEVRKHRTGAWSGELDGKEPRKPEPPRSDPNSKIPRPKTPPRGSGPVKLAINGGNA